MTRQTASESKPLPFEDDEYYKATLKAFKIEASKNPKYPDDQLKVELMHGEHSFGDYLGLKLGMRSDGSIAKLRQLLNALAERPKDEELWFDPDTLEWGYDLADDSTPAHAKLTVGMAVMFKGERRQSNGKSFYRVTGYKSAAKAKK